MRKRYQLSTGLSFSLATVVGGKEQAKGKRSITKEDKWWLGALGSELGIFFFKPFLKFQNGGSPLASWKQRQRIGLGNTFVY